MEDFGTPLDKNATELTVMDVYDIAAVVGQEFERIIDQFGCEASLRLMPKVVRVLEVLEVLVTRNNINPETEELRRELDRLRMERNDRLKKEQLHQKVCLPKYLAHVCNTKSSLLHQVWSFHDIPLLSDTRCHIAQEHVDKSYVINVLHMLEPHCTKYPGFRLLIILTTLKTNHFHASRENVDV